ncbi:MAG: sugar phosphate isomerase/epimerase [Clostridia bacterium]|nr:sugar phosphate isomerase/epimerase [Clostridia bacterium]
MEYGIQMYSVRDAVAQDYQAAFMQMGKLGYQKAELFGGMLPDAKTIRLWADQAGLKISGTHTGAPALMEENIQKTIEDHHDLGCNLLIIPGHDLSNKEKLDAFIQLVNAARPVLAQAGITLAYHNHSHEFVPNQDGQIIYDELVNRTEMKLELDTYWAYNAGKDPLQMMDALKNRLVAIHLKDGFMGGEGMPLGQGTAPVKAVWQKALDMNLMIIVESETCKPDGITEARECMEYLRSLEG